MLIPVVVSNYPIYSSDAVAGTIEIASGATLTANGSPNLTLSGKLSTWMNNGTFIPGSGTVTFNHGIITDDVGMTGSTQFNNVYVAANTWLKPFTNNVMKISGSLTWDASAKFDAVTDFTTVEFNGTSPQTIINPNGSTAGFHDLIISSTGSITWPTTLQVAGSFTNNKADNLEVGGTVEMIGSLGNHEINGNYSTKFTNLTNKDTNGSLTVSKNISVTGTLLTNAATVLDMAGNTLTLGTTTTNNGTIRFSGASNGLAIGTGTVDYYGTNQTVKTGSYNKLKLSNTSGTNSADGAISVSDSLMTTAGGALDMVGYTLSAGTFFNNGIIRFSGTSNGLALTTGTVDYYGSAAQTVNASATYSTLKISNTNAATISGNLTAHYLNVVTGAKLNVDAAKQFTVSSTLTNNGLITLKSNSADGTATLLTPSALSGSGSYKTEQYLTNQSWYLSSPMTGTVTPTNLSRIQAYLEGVNLGNDWSTTGTTMVRGKGYIVNVSSAPNTVEFTGTLNSGNISVEMTRFDETIINKYGFNLIGNPYPAYLDWTEVWNYTPDGGSTYPNRTKMTTSTMWYRTKVSGSWDFSTVNGASGYASPSNVSSKIPPMQAFWVRALNTGTSNLELTPTMVVHDNNSGNRLKVPGSNEVVRQHVRLQVNNGTTTCETLIYFDPSALNGFDAYDSPKFEDASTVTQIYTTVENQKLVINGMNKIPLDSEIGIGFIPGNATTFSIKANEVSNIPTGVKVILKDYANNNIETDLTDGVTTYQFSTVSFSGDRFGLIFRSPEIINGTLPNNQQFIVYPVNDHQIAIKMNGHTADSQLTVYNSIGQKLMIKQITSNLTVVEVPQPGAYLISVNGNKVNTTQKVIIN